MKLKVREKKRIYCYWMGDEEVGNYKDVIRVESRGRRLCGWYEKRHLYATEDSHYQLYFYNDDLYLIERFSSDCEFGTVLLKVELIHIEDD